MLFSRAIEVKYLPPTNNKGARLKAFIQGRSVVVPYDHSESQLNNHYNAAKALIAKLEWDWWNDNTAIMAQLPTGNYVFVHP